MSQVELALVQVSLFWLQYHSSLKLVHDRAVALEKPDPSVSSAESEPLDPRPLMKWCHDVKVNRDRCARFITIKRALKDTLQDQGFGPDTANKAINQTVSNNHHVQVCLATARSFFLRLSYLL